jgi:hypothetical protein
MDTSQLAALDEELEKLDCIIKASEQWAKQYTKDPTTHAKLIRSEAKLARQLRGFFRGMAADKNRFIDWNAYRGYVKADYVTDLIVQVTEIDGFSDGLMKVMFDPLLVSTAAGAVAGEKIYKVALGIDSTDAIMQQLTKEHVASLVGKIINKEGKIVDNPRSTYNILDKTRENIVESIKTSLDLGEDVETAGLRINRLLNNPVRSQLIAETETVNAYSQGLQEFGRQSGAAGKEWQDVSADDVCADYAALGPVEFDYDYDGAGLQGPVAHPRCRCGLRLIYPKEWDSLHK